jgi:hypothetical protein
MSSSLLILRQKTLLRINEANNSAVGALLSGSDGTLIADTSAALTDYLNEAAADLCRTCYPLAVTGSVAGVAAGVVPLSTLVVADGSTVWAVRNVRFAGNPLLRSSRSYAELQYPSLLTAAAPPVLWFMSGSSQLGLAPAPAIAGVVTVAGFGIPPKLVADGDVAGWLEPDLEKLLIFYAAAQICLKNMEDSSLAARAEVWMQQYEQGKQVQVLRLHKSDPALFDAHFAGVTVAK